MASIIPEHILNTLLCSICKQYLSCGPIKIMKNQERLLCGRCTSIIPCSPSLLYEQVAIFSLFPCINRYEGCNTLLKYQDVKQHEKTCLGTNYICPTCPNADYKPNSLLYLVDHYKTKHIACILDVPKFNVDSSKMAEICYLFWDTVSNCLFIIDVICTQDHIFMNASVAGKRKVVHTFKVNDSLLDCSVICPSLMNERSKCHTFHFKTATVEKNSPIWCELLYEVENRTATVVAMDIGSIEQPNLNTLRKLPKLYLDPEMFPGNKEHYQLSSCKSKLINTVDSKFCAQLKCGRCKTYFWNISDWTQEKLGTYISFRSKERNFLVCSICQVWLNERIHLVENPFETISSLHIFHLRFYCRYDCAGRFPIWQLYKHEKNCEFNLEKLSDIGYVKKCFGEDSYGREAKFVNGNIVKAFEFTYSSRQNPPEIPIYVVTDDGQKCKLSCKCEGNQLVVLASQYDKSKYQVNFRIDSDIFEDHVGGFSMMVAINRFNYLYYRVNIKCFVLWMSQIDRIDPEHILTI